MRTTHSRCESSDGVNLRPADVPAGDLEREQEGTPTRGILAPLSTHEEAALRKVGFGSDNPLEPRHVRRLLQLELIARDGGRWTLTEFGWRRYNSFADPRALGPLDAAQTE